MPLGVGGIFHWKRAARKLLWLLSCLCSVYSPMRLISLQLLRAFLQIIIRFATEKGGKRERERYREIHIFTFNRQPYAMTSFS